MARCIPLFLMLVVGVVQSASAQTPQPTPPLTASQPNSTKDVHIVLEIRWVDLSDNITERPELGLNKLPTTGAYSIFDDRQAKLLRVAESDKRSNYYPPQTVTVLNGEKRQVLPFGPRLPGTIQATVLNDRQTTEIRLTWAKGEDGKELMPTTTAAVPMGSHLLIHTHEHVFSRPVTTTSIWQEMKIRLFNQPRALPVREKRQVLLLISPRIALPGEKETQIVAK